MSDDRMMASPIHAQRRAAFEPASAICRDEILPVGQAVFVRINSLRVENPPATSIRYYRPSSQACGGPLAGIERLRLVCALPASPYTGVTRDFRAGFQNFGRLLACWSSLPLQPPQKSKSGFAKCFRLPLCVVAHGKQHTTEEFPNERKVGARPGNLTARSRKYAC